MRNYAFNSVPRFLDMFMYQYRVLTSVLVESPVTFSNRALSQRGAVLMDTHQHGLTNETSSQLAGRETRHKPDVDSEKEVAVEVDVTVNGVDNCRINLLYIGTRCGIVIAANFLRANLVYIQCECVDLQKHMYSNKVQQLSTKSLYTFSSFIINQLNSKIVLKNGLQCKDTILNFTSPTKRTCFSKFRDLLRLVFLFRFRQSTSYNLVFSLL